MTTPTQPPAAGFATTARILTGALMGALVFIGIAMAFVLETDTTPLWWLVLAQLGAGVVIHLLLDATGYRLQPLATDLTDEAAEAEARTRWQSAMIQRFAISEFIALGSLVLAFVVDGGFWTFLVGALVSLALMLVHVWPGSRSVIRSADALESGGRASFLRETFGVPAAGPMQQF